MRTINRDIVAALLYSKDGKILQALNAKSADRVYPDCWGIIGGGVEKGEDQRTALNREMLEESGIDIGSYAAELIFKSSGEAEKTLNTGERVFCRMKFYTYKVVMNDKIASEIKITLDDEHTEYRWVEPPELKALKLTPPSVELFTLLGYL
ncbi:MAG: NUDIX domain-containing protein [bacterium]|nr:NUDIX domain-containing protein [bacterium]